MPYTVSAPGTPSRRFTSKAGALKAARRLANRTGKAVRVNPAGVSAWEHRESWTWGTGDPLTVYEVNVDRGRRGGRSLFTVIRDGRHLVGSAGSLAAAKRLAEDDAARNT